MRIDDESAIEMYRRYRLTRASLSNDEEIADFGWEHLPDKLDAGWIPYALLLPESARSLANMVNQLYEYSYKLKAWNIVLNDCNEDDRLEYIYEFVDSIAVLILNLPFVVQNRFAFSVTHLCHQANRSVLRSAWVDDIPDDKEINKKTMRKYGKNWSSFESLENAIWGIFSTGHQTRTGEFRSKYTHRLPTEAVLGHTTFVNRKVGLKNTGRSYEFGHKPPIDLETLSGELLSEFRACLAAFKCFKNLVNEQIVRITNVSSQL